MEPVLDSWPAKPEDPLNRRSLKASRRRRSMLVIGNSSPDTVDPVAAPCPGRVDLTWFLTLPTDKGPIENPASTSGLAWLAASNPDFSLSRWSVPSPLRSLTRTRNREEALLSSSPHGVSTNTDCMSNSESFTISNISTVNWRADWPRVIIAALYSTHDGASKRTNEGAQMVDDKSSVIPNRISRLHLYRIPRVVSNVNVKPLVRASSQSLFPCFDVITLIRERT